MCVYNLSSRLLYLRASVDRERVNLVCERISSSSKANFSSAARCVRKRRTRSAHDLLIESRRMSRFIAKWELAHTWKKFFNILYFFDCLITIYFKVRKKITINLIFFLLPISFFPFFCKRSTLTRNVVIEIFNFFLNCSLPSLRMIAEVSNSIVSILASGKQFGYCELNT